VGSLSFLKIATGSSFVYLPPSSSISSLRRLRRFAGHVQHPAISALLWAAPRAAPAPVPPLPGLALASSTFPTSRRRRPDRHASRRCRELLLARATPLLVLKRAQLLLYDLLYSLEHPQTRAFLFPELDPSPDLRRRNCPPLTDAHTTPGPRSSAPRAPP
jgi:hypothetical protein